MFDILNNDSFSADELKELFSSVGWAQSLSAEDLNKAMNNSSHYVIARSDGRLVGFARSMDDDTWSANIDCMVVHQSYQRQGIGTALLNALLKQLSHLQYISAMPNSSETVSLYINCGFTLISDSRLLQIDQWVRE